MVTERRSIILKVQNLTKAYGGKPVVDKLSFELREGEVVGLLGPNGAGKTTAFYMTIGLIKPDSGSVFFKNQDVTDLPIHQRASLGMGYLAQEPSVFRQLTVEENVRSILETLNISQKDQEIRLKELLAELHLEPVAKVKAQSLSGGQRRRLEITRALVTEPALLLLDEPFANIDPLAVQELKKMIRHLQKRGITVLITDHNAREIFSIVDRSYLLQEGRVLLAGTPKEILESKEARSAYLGDDFKI